jgi:antitoxin ParD1/3/4
MNKPVQVTIAEPYDSFVEAQLESGAFKSAEDVVEAGLKLLKEEQARIEWLRKALIEGENSGPSVPFDPEDQMEEPWLRSGLVPPHAGIFSTSVTTRGIDGRRLKPNDTSGRPLR